MKCEICGKEFKNYKSLGAHLRTHKITSKEYYDRFLKKDGEGICPVCGKETSFKNLNLGYYNFCSCKCAASGENNPFFGKHHSEETKKKISDAEKGKHLSEKTRKKMSESRKGEKNPFYGKHHSEETKEKISNANKGKHHSEKTKKKISDAHKGENNYNYGKHLSEETKKKLSDAIKGENHPNYGKHLSEETKKKISDAQKGEKNHNYGKHLSEETKKKMSDAKKGENSPNYGKHFSEETKQKMSDAKKGKNHPNYKGGISLKEFEEAFGMEPEEWKKLAQEIRIRDNFTCQLCGKKNATDVHHIIPRRIRIDNSPDNLITLCRSCHIKIEHLTDIYLSEGKDPREIFFNKKFQKNSSKKINYFDS
jgi:hypothetical protein